MKISEYKLYRYEVYGKEIFGRMQHNTGIVKVKDKQRAEEWVREIYCDDLDIEWIEIDELSFLDMDDEEEHAWMSSFYDE